MSAIQCNVDLQAVQTLLVDSTRQANDYCHYSQRNRQMHAAQFVQLLVLGWLHNPQASLNELALQSGRLGFSISAQGLDARLTDRAVAFLAAVLQETLIHSHQQIPLAHEKLRRFSYIFVTDSTQIRLPETLTTVFKGYHGSTALKLQVTLDYLHGQIGMVHVTQGNQPDQNCDQAVRQAVPNSLNLFDLGYFKQEYLRDIDQQQAYFVTRYQTQTALYDPDTGEKLVLEAWLGQQNARQIERPCLMGGRVRLPVRVLARRLPEQAAAARRRKAKRKARGEGKTCSQRYLELLGWEILVTNLSIADWCLQEIFALYPIRWQIELVFRAWKSQLGLAHLGNWRIERVLCQLYAHLIGAILCVQVSSPYRYRASVEYSLPKLIHVVCHFATDFMTWLAGGCRSTPILSQKIESAFHRHARKDKRKKAPSTLHTFIHSALS